MPLVKSPTKKAFSKNISTEMHEGIRGKKPSIKQAVAVAYSIQRKAKAGKAQ